MDLVNLKNFLLIFNFLANLKLFYESEKLQISITKFVMDGIEASTDINKLTNYNEAQRLLTKRFFKVEKNYDKNYNINLINIEFGIKHNMYYGYINDRNFHNHLMNRIVKLDDTDFIKINNDLYGKIYTNIYNDIIKP